MSSEILLVTLPDFDNRTIYPLGLASIAAYLENNGYADKIEIIDGSYLRGKFGVRRSVSKIIEKINNEKPHIVGISLFRHVFGQLIDLLERVKYRPNFVLGGHEATALHNCLFDWFADFGLRAVVRGEGEATFKELADALFQERDLHGINGITFKDGENIVVNPNRKLLDLEKLPPPAFHLLQPFKEYGYTGDIEESRGCCYSCSFCSIGHFYDYAEGTPKYRLKSPEKIREDVKHLRNFGGRAVRFVGENVLLDGERALKIADVMEEEGIETWGIDGHAQLIVKQQDILPTLVKKGLYNVEIGVESATQHCLDIYNKQTTPTLNQEALGILKKSGILASIDFINFNPLMTFEDLVENIVFLAENYTDLAVEASYPNILFHDLTPYLNTPIRKRLKEAGLIGGMRGDFFEEVEYQDPKVAKALRTVTYFVRHHSTEYKKMLNELKGEIRAYREDPAPTYFEKKFISLASLPLEILILATYSTIDNKPGVRIVKEHYKKRTDAINSGEYAFGADALGWKDISFNVKA
jgi:radical SAM superfamily enzyme YgiQ (UPF0313 family)